MSREHYVSKNLLERLGVGFTVKGVPWAADEKRVGIETLTARVLCRRHNNALSPLDSMIGTFYDLLRRAVHGHRVGEHEFDGEDLERWAVKLMLGIGVSGNVSYPGVGKVIAKAVPEEYLRIVFSEAEMPPGCGFGYLGAPLTGLEGLNNLSWVLNHYVNGEEAGRVFGITVKVFSCFQYLTTVLAPVEELNGIHVYRRPGGFVLGVPERGHIRLRWGGQRTNAASLILRLTR